MIDALIVIVLLAYAAVGYRRGFVGSAAELAGLLLGLAVAFLLSEPLGGAAAGFLQLPRGLLDLGAFLIIWSLIEFAIAFGWKRLSARVPAALSEHPANRLTGIAPALLKGITLVVIVLLIVATAPIPASAKEPFTGSRLGKVFLAAGTTFQQQVNGLFGEALRDTLAFKTVKTDSTETAELGFTDASGPECLGDARALFDRANEERAERGLGRLAWDDGQRWLLIVRKGEETFTLLDELVQLGTVGFTAVEHASGDQGAIVVETQAGAGVRVRSYVFDRAAGGFVSRDSVSASGMVVHRPRTQSY